MENMDKRLNVPKWVLINRPKIPQNLSAQIVWPSPKVWDFDEKRLHWASVVRSPWSVVLVIGAAMNNPNYYFCQFLMKVTLQLL